MGSSSSTPACCTTSCKYELHNSYGKCKDSSDMLDPESKPIDSAKPALGANGDTTKATDPDSTTLNDSVRTSSSKPSFSSKSSNSTTVSQLKTVQFARSVTMESHCSPKRVSAVSQDSCATISDCSSQDSNSCHSLEDIPDSAELYLASVADVQVEGSELDYNSNIDSLGDTIGEMPGLLRNTPRHQLPYKSSRLGRSVNRSTSQDELILWKKGNRLGRGTFGTVFLGLTKTGELIAVKQVDLIETEVEETEKEYTKIFQEVTLLKSLVHDNIVKYLGSTYEHHTVSIFTEFIPGGSLATIIERFGPLELPVTARYTRQLLNAIAYMHENGVVHRDIKSANIMLVPNGTVKLIDFGCAKRLALRLSRSGSHLQKSLRGTPYWMAPEVVNDSGHGRKSDIWSLGCTVFELVTGKPPWGDREPFAAMYAIGSDDFPVPTLPESFRIRVRDFVSQCMMRDKLKRPPAKQLLQHDFVTPPFPDDENDDENDDKNDEEDEDNEGNEDDKSDDTTKSKSHEKIPSR